MMKGSIYGFVHVALLILTLCGSCAASNTTPECTEDGYAQYGPVFYHAVSRPASIEESFVVDESRVGAEHYENIKYVFDYYGIKYKVVDGKVMVDCAVWKDKDRMDDYTREAMDENWLRRTRYQLWSVETKAGTELRMRDRTTNVIMLKIIVPFEGVGGFSEDARRIIWEEYPPVPGKKIIVFDAETGEPIGKATVEKDASFFDVTPDDKQLTYKLSDENNIVINKRIDLEPISANP
jgi:hypothetical protein